MTLRCECSEALFFRYVQELDRSPSATNLKWPLLCDAQIGGGEEGVELVAGAFDVLPCAFFSVDDGDDFYDGDAEGFEDFGGFEDLAAGGEDVFDDEDSFAGVEEAFDLFGGAVVLFLVADVDAGFAGGHGGDGCEGYGAEFGSGDAVDVGGDVFGEEFSEGLQNVALGFEPVFVEVVVALPAGPEREISAKEGNFGDACCQCLSVHRATHHARREF